MIDDRADEVMLLVVQNAVETLVTVTEHDKTILSPGLYLMLTGCTASSGSASFTTVSNLEAVEVNAPAFFDTVTVNW